MAENTNFGAEPLAAPMQRMRPGGFWRRFAAYLIDYLVIGLPFMILGMAFVPAMIASPGESASVFLLGGKMLMNILQMVVTFCYFGFFLSKKGASPGKMVMGLRVVDNENGTNLSFMMAGLRCTVGYLISGITLLIGFIMVGFRQDKKALHDLIFNSHVWYKS